MVSAGDEVGGYTLVHRLGSGGMGTVWEARDAEGSAVAIKLLHPAISADPDARSRLAREVANLHRVRGNRVARVLDAEVEDDLAFVVTDLVEGLSLEESVAQEGAFDPVDLHPLAEGLFEAVAQVHDAGLLHRDLKPGNVMVTYDGPVLIDFGIAQLADDDRLTHTGFVTGTPGFLDPATLSGGALGRAGDWFGWAAVLLFAATGRPPFGRGPMEAVLGRMTTARPDLDHLSPAVAAAFRNALAPDPAARPEPHVLLQVLENDALGVDQEVPAATALVPAPPGPVAGADATTLVPAPPGPTWRGEGTTAQPEAAAGAGAGAGTGVRDGAGPGAGPAPTRRMPTTQPPAQQPRTSAGVDTAAAGAAPGADATTVYPPSRSRRGRKADERGRTSPSSPLVSPQPGAAAPGLVAAGQGGPADVPWAAAPQAPPPAWALPPRPQRALVVSSGAFVVALAFGWPGVAVTTAGIGFALLTALGLVERRTRVRRLGHGPRPSDRWAAVGWTLPMVALGLLTAVVPLGVGAIVAVSLWWLGMTVAAGELVGQVPAGWSLLVTPLALAAGLTAAWWVPVADATRLGARAFWRSVAPSGTVRQVWVLLLVGLAVGLALAGLAGIGSGGDGVWWPLPTPPQV
ncbi:serine/threonine-protein kinase [Serinibacter arcticus]|nr:serine/threonine-protein kinase [Serinibacter arcticus]